MPDAYGGQIIFRGNSWYNLRINFTDYSSPWY